MGQEGPQRPVQRGESDGGVADLHQVVACQQLESGSASRPVGPSQLQQAETKTERSSP